MKTDLRPSTSLSLDERLAELVDELAVRMQAGEAIDLEALTRAHPEFADRLEPLLPTLRALAGFGVSNTANDPTLPSAGVLGDFRIIREVGRGGMGIVYEAQQLSLGGRQVALKILPFAGMFDRRYLLRFQNEARATASLHHPHIVPVYAVGCDHGVHYYAMQFIDGMTLAAAIEGLQTQDQQTRADHGSPPDAGAVAEAPLQISDSATLMAAALSSERTAKPHEFIRTVARLGRQAASALDHAHQQGIIHRDIKPANLLLDGNRNVWVTDFGLAHFREECGVTRTGEVVGTLRYMSPEQTHGRQLVDHRTDIYSLGVTLYELLTLHAAFRGDRGDLLRRITTEDPPPARRFNPAIPVELETIVAKAMSKAPEERYRTAQELADDLQRWLDDKPILARPLTSLQKFRKWSRRHLSFVIGLAVTLILLTAGVVVWSILYAVQQKHFADQQSQFAHERELSERKIAGDLQRVRIGRAEAVRMARLPGYRRQVWADLREASTLADNADSVDQRRAVVLACLGDPVGLDPVANPEAIPRQQLGSVPPDIEKKIRRPTTGIIKPTPRTDLFVAVEMDRFITFYDTAGRKTSLIGGSPLGGIYDLTFVPNGWSIVAGCEQGFFVWGIPTGERWVVPTGNITSVAVSPNGRFLAVGGQQLELWSLAGSRLIVSIPYPTPGARVEFSADGRILLAVVNGKAVAGWELSDTPERRVFDGHTLGVPAVAFHPDSRRLASVSKDRLVRIWDSKTGKIIGDAPIGHPAEIEAIAFNADGSRFATGDLTGAVRVWDTTSRNVLAEHGSGAIWRVQFSSNGQYLVAAGAFGVAVWKLSTTATGGVALTAVRLLAAPGPSPYAIDIAIRPGGSEAVFLTRDGRIYSFDLNRLEDPPRLLIEKVRYALRSLHFDPRGNRLSFITRTNTFGYWNWQEKKVTDTQCRAEWIALSEDGRWAALGLPGQSITVIEVATGKEVFALPTEGSVIWSLAWSADGRQLAVGLADGRVAIWNLEQVRARLAEFGIESPSTAR